jgi:hypothetical protein
MNGWRRPEKARRDRQPQKAVRRFGQHYPRTHTEPNAASRRRTLPNLCSASVSACSRERTAARARFVAVLPRAAPRGRGPGPRVARPSARNRLRHAGSWPESPGAEPNTRRQQPSRVLFPGGDHSGKVGQPHCRLLLLPISADIGRHSGGVRRARAAVWPTSVEWSSPSAFRT